MVSIEWGPMTHLGIIAIAAVFLLVVLLVVVCLVSPHCWCHKHCLCIPRYPGEGYQDMDIKYDVESGRKELSDVSSSSMYKDPEYRILTESTDSYLTTSEKTEETPLTTFPNRQYDSVSSNISSGPAPDYRHYYSRKPVKSLEVDISWNHKDGTAKVRLKTLHLTRVKRRKGLQVLVELVTDKRPLVFSNPFRWGRGDGVVAEHRTEIRQQTAQVTLEETFSIDWVSISGRGTLRFTVHAAEGATVTDVIGKAELPLQELDTSERRSIRLYLTSPLMVVKGNCQVSLCYLPTAEKLSVVVGDFQRTCGPNMKEGEEHDVYVQMSLLFKNRALGKKKTSFRRMRGVEFPELTATHTFDMPPDRLHIVCLLINFKRVAKDSDSDRTPPSSEKGSYSADTTSDVFSDDDQVQSLPNRDVTIGTVIIGLESGLPDAQAHWSQMIATPRTPVIQWHRVL